jgi:hypothetical protein
VPDLQHELNELYAGALEEFTAGRNDLARRLRAAGQTDEAERVAALRKPSLPVWTVNRLVRLDPEGAGRLVEAAERVEASQTGAAGAGALAEAVEAHRTALQSLVDAAGEALGRPLTGDVRQRASATLRAASLDPASRDRLLGGMLESEPAETGFDLVAGLGVASPPPRAAARPSRAAAAAKKELRARLRAARAELAAHRKELAAARKDAAAARRRADSAEKHANELEARLEQEERAAADLERELESS